MKNDPKLTMICIHVEAKDLIQAGQEDVYNGINDSIHHTMWMLINLTGNMKYYLDDEEIESIKNEELDLGGIINPYVYEYHIIHRAKRNGRKIVDRRNKQEVEKIKEICGIAYRLYTIGVENPTMEI
jgi:hypothetical protein